MIQKRHDKQLVFSWMTAQPRPAYRIILRVLKFVVVTAALAASLVTVASYLDRDDESTPIAVPPIPPPESRAWIESAVLWPHSLDSHSSPPHIRAALSQFDRTHPTTLSGQIRRATGRGSAVHLPMPTQTDDSRIWEFVTADAIHQISGNLIYGRYLAHLKATWAGTPSNTHDIEFCVSYQPKADEWKSWRAKDREIDALAMYEDGVIAINRDRSRHRRFVNDHFSQLNFDVPMYFPEGFVVCGAYNIVSHSDSPRMAAFGVFLENGSDDHLLVILGDGTLSDSTIQVNGETSANRSATLNTPELVPVSIQRRELVYSAHEFNHFAIRVMRRDDGNADCWLFYGKQRPDIPRDEPQHYRIISGKLLQKELRIVAVRLYNNGEVRLRRFEVKEDIRRQSD